MIIFYQNISVFYFIFILSYYLLPSQWKPVWCLVCRSRPSPLLKKLVFRNIILPASLSPISYFFSQNSEFLYKLLCVFFYPEYAKQPFQFIPKSWYSSNVCKVATTVHFSTQLLFIYFTLFVCSVSKFVCYQEEANLCKILLITI